jgi:exopolyphosphatase/guanosine-5'-triphosphate,3'-diphosphate pyrophosphatase
MHEIGISIAHSSYHKHSAYVLANADMPGFSKRDQALLSHLVIAHRGKLERVQTLGNLERDQPEWLLIFCLRLAALLHRARDDTPLPDIAVTMGLKGFQLQVERAWLDTAPLTAAVLEEEALQWQNLGIEYKLRGLRVGK